jgi:hypothetical protein
LSLRDVLKAIRGRPTPPNEETAKLQIIRPVLDQLGWDTTHPEVLWEHHVGDGKGGGKVDIALKGGRRIVALIEAKAPSQGLNKHVAQVLGYAFYEGINICVLTNGPEWRLYLPKEDGPPDERCFAILDLMEGSLEQLSDDLEAFLGKDNLLSGHSKRRALVVLRARRQADHLNTKLPKIWSRMVQGPNAKLVELVIEQTYKELNLRPVAEQVKAVLRNQPVPTVLTPGRAEPEGQRQPPKQGSEDPPPETGARRKAAKIVAYELWGERHEVKTWVEMMVGVAEALYERHGASFDRILTVRGRKHPYAARSRDDIAKAPRAVGTSGVYIETHASAKNLTRRATQYLKLFGHSADDLRIETQSN